MRGSWLILYRFEIRVVVGPKVCIKWGTTVNTGYKNIGYKNNVENTLGIPAGSIRKVSRGLAELPS
jgi:hypothetical protein